MKRLVLGTVLIAGLTGCDRAANAQAKANATPVTLNAIKAAQFTKKKVDDHEKRVADLLLKIRAQIDTLKPGDIKTERQTIEELKNLIARLKGWARSLTDNDKQLREDLASCSKALEASATAYKEASALYAGYAEGETAESFKEEYKEMSERCLNFSHEMTRRQKALTGSSQVILEKFDFAHRSLIFLDRLDEFLDLYPSDEVAERVQKYMEDLNKYIEKFQESLNVVRQFSDTATKEAGKAN